MLSKLAERIISEDKFSEVTKLRNIPNSQYANSAARTSLFLTLGCLVCILAGCFGGETITKAGGIVKFKGEPLTTGTIEFYPVGGGRSSNSVIQSDGTFTLSYRKPGDGLPPGEYKVAVISVKEKKSKRRKKEEANVDGSYDEADIYADNPGKSVSIIPTIYNNIQTTTLRQTVVDDGSVQYLEVEVPEK